MKLFKILTIFISLFLLGVLVLFFGLIIEDSKLVIIITRIGLALIAIGYLIFIIFWKCPFCQKHLPYQDFWKIKHCPHCGNKIDIFKD